MTDTPYSSSHTTRRRAIGASLLVAALLGLGACSDSSAPVAPAAGDAPNLLLFGTASSSYKVGDTTITKIVLQPGTAAYDVALGNGNKITFPRGASSVCDQLTSSYGPGTWDAPCLRSLLPVTVYASTWTDARGLSHGEFQPAMRFVPSDVVLLEMRNKNGLITAGMRIDFCTQVGCVNEAAADPTVATVLNPSGGAAKRRIKHFSGYMVSVGLTDEGDTEQNLGIQ